VVGFKKVTDISFFAGKYIMDEEKKSKGVCDEQRREFLKTSMYAAYATPVIMSLLVEKANAGTSSNPHCEDPAWIAEHPGVCPGT
jgi:hypothetical protein